MVGLPKALPRVANTRAVLACALLVLLFLALSDPRGFVGLWLTPDQQGWLAYRRGDYEAAARYFSDPRWRGMALYAAQDFEAAGQYFSQYADAEGLLARGNALAHRREYLAAREIYRELARRYPAHPAPAVNLPLVQALIDANRELSESQVAEAGDLASEREEGPRSSEGGEQPNFVEREQLCVGQVCLVRRLEQLTAQQLLEDPELRATWLRQVRRDPAEFLATKFHRQLERAEASP